jgi:hypothetical protein
MSELAYKNYMLAVNTSLPQSNELGSYWNTDCCLVEKIKNCGYTDTFRIIFMLSV